MRYYFDIREGDALHRDEFGVELDSDEDARIEAQSLAIEAIRGVRFSAVRKIIKVEVRRDGEDQIYAATLEVTGHTTSD